MAKKRTLITMPMRKRIRELRALGVTLTRIAKDLGISYESVCRHASDAQEAKIKAYQRKRYMMECNDKPEAVERRRAKAREYAARKRAERDAKLPRKVTEPLDVDKFVEELLVTDKVILDTLGAE